MANFSEFLKTLGDPETGAAQLTPTEQKVADALAAHDPPEEEEDLEAPHIEGVEEEPEIEVGDLEEDIEPILPDVDDGPTALELLSDWPKQPHPEDIPEISDEIFDEAMKLTGDGVEVESRSDGATVTVPPPQPHILGIVGSGTDGAFPVLLTQDGGAAGGAAAECTYTYTVLLLDDATELDTGVTPQRPRLHFIAYWYAGETRTLPNVATSRYGLAAHDADGTLLLLDAFGEIAKTTVCP